MNMSEASTLRDSSPETNLIDIDPSISDVSMIDSATSSRVSTFGRSEPSDTTATGSVPTSVAPTPRSTMDFATPRGGPSTPKATAAVEHDDDIPMMDISPGRDGPPADPGNPTAPESWEAGPLPEYSKIALADPATTIVDQDGQPKDELKH